MSTIESLYVFEGFAKEEIAYFLLMSQTQNRRKGETVFSQGDPSNGCAYYINAGHVKVMIGGQEVAVLGPGALFGEMAMIIDEPRTASIETIDEAELQVFLKEDFLVLLNRSSHSKEIKMEMLRRMKENVKK